MSSFSVGCGRAPTAVPSELLSAAVLRDVQGSGLAPPLSLCNLGSGPRVQSWSERCWCRGLQEQQTPVPEVPVVTRKGLFDL